MEKMIVGLLIFLFSTSSVFASTAQSETESVVFGSNNVQVHSSAEATVNDKSVKVKSNQPGSIKVEMKDDQVNIETGDDITPTIFVSDEEIKPTIFQDEPMAQPVSQVIQLPRKIFVSLKNFLNRIFGIFTP